MKQIFVLFFFIYTSSLFSITAPKYGQNMPEHVKSFFNKVQSSYSEGYYSQKFEERRYLREKISKGLLPQSVLTVDTVFALTLLGRYSDSNPRYTREQFQQKLFDGPNPTGTITDYYREVSYNQLIFTGYCSNWYQVPGTMASYVGNDNGLSSNGGPRFTLDLIKAADSTLDYSNFIQYYDSQGNPRIGFVAVVHTGAGAEAGAQNIWSHRWNFRMLTGNQPYRTNDIDPASGKY
ncbi:MAG: immune inhibitor A domain-containing protein, partial [Ignavibacteria bacterium]